MYEKGGSLHDFLISSIDRIEIEDKKASLFFLIKQETLQSTGFHDHSLILKRIIHLCES